MFILAGGSLPNNLLQTIEIITRASCRPAQPTEPASSRFLFLFVEILHLILSSSIYSPYNTTLLTEIWKKILSAFKSEQFN